VDEPQGGLRFQRVAGLSRNTRQHVFKHVEDHLRLVAIGMAKRNDQARTLILKIAQFG